MRSGRFEIGMGWFVPILLLAAAAAASAAARDGDFLFAVTTDYETVGECAKIGLETPWPVAADLEPVGSDPVVRTWGNRIYVVNRLYSDNIQVIEPDPEFATVLEFSVGPGSNPQDIVFVNASRAYVSRYESTWLYEVNPATGAVTDSVDLSPFADVDGLPEMARMALCRGRLFVQIQRIDRTTWTPLLPSYLAVVDVATNALVDADPSLPGVQGIPLRASNPNGQMQADEKAGGVYVGETGAYLSLDGGVEKIDARNLVSDGWVVTEAALGGDLGAFALGKARGFAAVSSDWFYSTRLVSFGPDTGTFLASHYTTSGYVPDIELDTATAQLFLADRKITAPGVHVFDEATGTRLTTSPRNTGLPPADLALFRTVVSGVDEASGGDAPPGVRAAWAEPNPSRSGTTLRFSAPATAIFEASVYDIRGRLVRTIARSEAPGNGAASFRWDGRDDGGRSVPPGIYFFRGDGEGNASSGRVLVVR
jgi:hypothetical protein